MDATISREEIAVIRNLVRDLGLYAAARQLGVDRTTLNVLMGGRQPRHATCVLLKSSLKKVKA